MKVLGVVISIVVLALTWAALDDITTGTEGSFVAEWAMVAVAAAWFTVVAGWRIRQHHRN